MKVLGGGLLSFLCIADDFPRSRGHALLRLWVKILRFRHIGKRVPGAWSAFLRTVRDGVRDRAREDQVLVLCSVSCLAAEDDEAAAED